MRMYSIYDRAACEYAPPFLSRNDATAIRMYSGYLKGVPENVSKSDFVLSYIADWDADLGKIYPKDIIEVVPYRDGDEAL